MGIMLNMVSPPERSTAISVTTFLMMTFGLLPAPYVYGAIYDMTKICEPIIITDLNNLLFEKKQKCHSV